MGSLKDTGKVLVLSGVRGDTRRYRSLHLYEQLRLAGADCVLSHLTDPHLPEYAAQASAAVLHRVAYDGYVEKIFRILRERGAVVVLDADDYLYDPAIMQWIDSPDFQDPVRAALYRREILRHRAALDRCDAVTVSTGFLGQMLADAGKPVYVHRNAYSLEMLALSEAAYRSQEKQGERVVIGYASGTPTHDKDFAMIRPVLAELMDRYPQVELWLMGPVGAGEGWGTLRERVRPFPLVPWRELPARLAALDINLAPLLPESPFNHAKSEIKFMEAALVRVPTVASGTDAFLHAITPGETGFIANTSDAWLSALASLITCPERRRAVGEAAHQAVLARCDPAKRGADYLTFLDSLAEQIDAPPVRRKPVQPGSSGGVGYFTPEDERYPTMADLARYSIRHRGALTLLGQVWVFFRRKLAPLFPFKSAGG